MLPKLIVLVVALLSVSAQAGADNTPQQPENKAEVITQNSGDKGESDHESVVFLAQGMSGFIGF
ncbi:hypothetical protein ACOYA6_07920 [Leclercia barmai]|uniref:hypothetical protein n=1 Tax=Leclercia TaxID=83654 RepID=UPI00057AC599|nr:hypothetical protein [Leclercia adecarboxylata]